MKCMLSLDVSMSFSLLFLAEEIRSFFQQFGSVTVDWPHKNQNKGCIPPKGTHAQTDISTHTNVVSLMFELMFRELEMAACL